MYQEVCIREGVRSVSFSEIFAFLIAPENQQHRDIQIPSNFSHSENSDYVWWVENTNISWTNQNITNSQFGIFYPFFSSKKQNLSV